MPERAIAGQVDTVHLGTNSLPWSLLFALVVGEVVSGMFRSDLEPTRTGLPALYRFSRGRAVNQHLNSNPLITVELTVVVLDTRGEQAPNSPIPNSQNLRHSRNRVVGKEKRRRPC